MKHALALLTCLSLLCATKGRLLATDADTSHPNFILIVADDLGMGDLGCYDGWIETPNIDRLASEGVRFTDFHSNGPVCSPTRAALFTGTYQQQVGIPGVVVAREDAPAHQHGLPDEITTMPEWLRGKGYATALFGKWHLGYFPRFNPVEHGFEQFRGYVSGNVDYFSHVDQVGNFDWWHNKRHVDDEGYVTTLISDYAVKFIHEHNREHFFLVLAHEAPHYPYQGPNDKAERTVGGQFPNHGSRKDKRIAYREMVQALDASVGRVLDALQQTGVKRQTLVWFFSDNGATRLGSNGPYRGHKGSVWEGGHRVPSIVRWPGKIEPRTSDASIMTMDVMPTLQAIVSHEQNPRHANDSSIENQDTTPKRSGVDVSAHLLNQDRLATRDLFWQYRKQSAVRSGDWKLVQIGNQPARLFNLKNDPSEQHDLAKMSPTRLSQLQGKLDGWTDSMKSAANRHDRGGSSSAVAGITKGPDDCNRIVETFLRRHKVPGAAVAVTRFGKIVYARGFGYADREAGKQAKANSRFRIASLSKPITAVAILQLIERGQLEIDDRVFNVLDYNSQLTSANASPDSRLQRITIRQLLQHRAGWDRSGSFDPMFQSVRFAQLMDTSPPADTDTIVQAMLKQHLDFVPGARYAYSNFGFSLLGRVIEQQSGTDYESFVQNNVFQPLGIQAMQLGKTRLVDRAAGEVRYYHPDPAPSVFSEELGQDVAAPYGGWYLEAMDAHGGWIGSVVDLARFAVAFDDPDNCPILTRESIRLMHARPEGSAGYREDGQPKDVYYSLGWMNRVDSNGRVNHWHNGSLPGTTAIMIRRHDGLNMVGLLNTRVSPKSKDLGLALDRLLHTVANHWN